MINIKEEYKKIIADYKTAETKQQVYDIEKRWYELSTIEMLEKTFDQMSAEEFEKISIEEKNAFNEAMDRTK